MWHFTWIVKVLDYDTRISIVKWTRFEGKSSCLYQDTKKHLDLGPEKKHSGIYQRNRYCSSGQRWKPNDTDYMTARFSLVNIRTVWHWPLDSQIQPGQHPDQSDTDHSTARLSLANIRTNLTLTTRQSDSAWPTSGPIWHWTLDSQVHVKASVPTASYFWVCPLEQDWPTEPAYGMLPYLTVRQAEDAAPLQCCCVGG